jgi:hypothetical protein
MPTMCHTGRKTLKTMLRGARGYCDATCDNPGAGRGRDDLRFGPRRLPGDLVPVIDTAPLRVGDRRPARRQPVRVRQLRRTNKKQTGWKRRSTRRSMRHRSCICHTYQVVANQRISTCRSHCDGDTTHPVWVRTCAASAAAFLLATAILACQTRAKNAELQSPATGPNPHADIWGSENVEKIPSEIMGASHARRNLVRGMGPQCRCAARNATATRVGARACGAWGVQPRRAARRKAQRSSRVCGT